MTQQSQMDINLESIKSMDVNLALQHLTEINASKEDYEEAFLTQNLDFVDSIGSGFKKYFNNIYNFLRIYKLSKTVYDTIKNGIGPTNNPNIIAINPAKVSIKLDIKTINMHKLLQKLKLKSIKINIEQHKQLIPIEDDSCDFKKWQFYNKTDINSKIDEIKQSLRKVIEFIDVENKKINIPAGSQIKTKLFGYIPIKQNDWCLKIPLNILDDDYEERIKLSSSKDIILKQGWIFCSKTNEEDKKYISNEGEILEFPQNHKKFLNICDIY